MIISNKSKAFKLLKFSYNLTGMEEYRKKTKKSNTKLNELTRYWWKQIRGANSDLEMSTQMIEIRESRNGFNIKIAEEGGSDTDHSDGGRIWEGDGGKMKNRVGIFLQMQ